MFWLVNQDIRVYWPKKALSNGAIYFQNKYALCTQQKVLSELSAYVAADLKIISIDNWYSWYSIKPDSIYHYKENDNASHSNFYCILENSIYFSTLKLRFLYYFVLNGVILFKEMKNTKLKRKILIVLDFGKYFFFLTIYNFASPL